MVQVPVYYFGDHWWRRWSVRDDPRWVAEESFPQDDPDCLVAQRLFAANGGRFSVPYEEFTLAVERPASGGWWGTVSYQGQAVTFLAFAPDERAAALFWPRLVKLWESPLTARPLSDFIKELKPWVLPPDLAPPAAPWGMWLSKCADECADMCYHDPEEIYRWLWLLLAREAGLCVARFGDGTTWERKAYD